MLLTEKQIKTMDDLWGEGHCLRREVFVKTCKTLELNGLEFCRANFIEYCPLFVDSTNCLSFCDEVMEGCFGVSLFSTLTRFGNECMAVIDSK